MAIAHAFEYERPESIDEAVEMLKRHGGDARVLAGGTDLIGWLRAELVAPDVIVDITPQELEAIGARRRDLDQLPSTPTTAPATQHATTGAAAKPLEILLDAQLCAALEWVRTPIQVPGIDEAQYPTGHQAGAHNGIAD